MFYRYYETKNKRNLSGMLVYQWWHTLLKAKLQFKRLLVQVNFRKCCFSVGAFSFTFFKFLLNLFLLFLFLLNSFNIKIK